MTETGSSFTPISRAKGPADWRDPNAALLFHWKSLRRQIRLEGPLTPVTEAEADEYFLPPQESQIGAWASDQSRPTQGRFELEKRVASFAAKFGLGTVPMPAALVGIQAEPALHRILERRCFSIT